ncbi:MAG: DUF1592 domain-containing protein [Gammaproteobacteria bacterium]|jgi:mono/diheme cytochrome c family protein|nr:DUF1592 domain-containing protein [Gammaproteobacteria bacterium]MBT6043956.1 DUF1592 domain-containing protein [Gammaproteobacteria bacterium]
MRSNTIFNLPLYSALLLGRKLTFGLVMSIPVFAQAQSSTESLDAGHRQMLDQYCTECHNFEDYAGGLAFELLETGNLLNDAETWEKVLLKLKAGMMPPLGKDRPAGELVNSFVSGLEQSIDSAWAVSPNTGAPLLHRMNRTEYENAIRDLLNLPINAASMFPADNSSEGFDNIASVLSVSPALMQSYISAANKVSRLAVGDMTASLTTATYRADQQDQSSHLEGISLGTRGGLVFEHVFPLDAEYEFRISRSGANAAFSLDPVGIEDPVELVIDGERVKLFPAGTGSQVSLTIPAGPHTIEAAFVKTQSPLGVDDLHTVWSDSTVMRSVAISGPVNATGPGNTPSRSAIFSCTPASTSDEEPCARQILEDLAYRAYRRPVSARSLNTLMAFYRDGRELRDFDTGIQYALARVLVDPMFVFRFEEEPAGLEDGQTYAVNDFELASRLSFFIWSSIPDEELLAVAESGELTDPDILEQQIQRMLQDPKSRSLVENFASSWLSLGQLNSVNPTSTEFDGSLRVAMKRETELLLESVMLEDRNVMELLTANYTYVNERLAKHYGIPNIRGSHFRKVDLNGTGRQGLLGHGSILTITSAPNRTSPVIRGAWIMENLLGTPPPPPPPGVETNLEETAEAGAAPTTLRQRLEQHRADPSCAACHNMMDPIGFALENFDEVGKFREYTNGQQVNTQAVFWDGTEFQGPQELHGLLMVRSDLFVENFTEKLMTYALGRKVEFFDMPSVRRATRQAEQEGNRFSVLVKEIALSEAFTRRTKGNASDEAKETAQR